MRDFEIKTSMLFNLLLILILLCFFFFLIIDLNFLISAVIAQVFNSIAELVIPIEIPSENEKAEIEMHPVTPEAKKESFQYNLVSYKDFCASYSSIHFCLFL